MSIEPPHVVAAGIGDRLAVVERLELGELVGMLLEQVAEPPDQPRALAGRDARPGPGLERAARGRDREIDVRLVACRDVGDDLLGRRILDRKVLPLAASTHLPSISI